MRFLEGKISDRIQLRPPRPPSDWSSVPSRTHGVIHVLTAHAVSHEGLANNHEICKPRIGHGLEPKIFWVPLCGTGIAEEELSFFCRSRA